VTVWYAPILRLTGQWYDCFEDKERTDRDDDVYDTGEPAYYLASHPGVQCNGAGMDDGVAIININTALISLFVGIGLPVLIFCKVEHLKNAGKLNADSSFHSLYEGYTPSMAYFEAIHLFRKALLILGMTVPAYLSSNLADTGVNASLIQALTGLLINIGFFALVWATRPYAPYPCSLFRNNDLNNLAELAGAGVTVAGSILAVIGSFSPYNQDLMNLLGLIFAVMNLSFVVVLACGFQVDINRTEGHVGRKNYDDNYL